MSWLKNLCSLGAYRVSHDSSETPSQPLFAPLLCQGTVKAYGYITYIHLSYGLNSTTAVLQRWLWH